MCQALLDVATTLIAGLLLFFLLKRPWEESKKFNECVDFFSLLTAEVYLNLAYTYLLVRGSKPLRCRFRDCNIRNFARIYPGDKPSKITKALGLCCLMEDLNARISNSEDVSDAVYEFRTQLITFHKDSLQQAYEDLAARQLHLGRGWRRFLFPFDRPEPLMPDEDLANYCKMLEKKGASDPKQSQ